MTVALSGRLPAEWEPQSGIMLTWPRQDGDFARAGNDQLPRVENSLLEIATIASRQQRVLLACYLALLARFGRFKATCGTACMLGFVLYPTKLLYVNGLLLYLHGNYPAAFGVIGLFFTIYLVSLGYSVSCAFRTDLSQACSSRHRVL